jgi:hypothetical protein
MSASRPAALAAAVALCAATACAAAAPEFGGQVRLEATDTRPAPRGPLAQAAALAPGIVAQPASGLALEAELRAAGQGLTAVATLRQERLERDRLRSRGWVNELYASGGGTSWQFSAGKKIVGWDVGYGFRPNDVVQQEARRTLLATTAEGRPLLLAERYDADTAWSFVLVNPTKSRAHRGAEEPALAARAYLRDGAVDWHAFARCGGHTRGSLGAAAAWVASDAIELHASLRWLAAADTVAIDPAVDDLARSDPWAPATVRHAAQALFGGTWTNAHQISVLAEAWWDGTALSDAQWDAWNQRNRQLAALAGGAAPAAAIAGNLAWQADAYGAASNLRRANLFVRLSWTHDAWQPAIDLLYTPADAGRVITASLAWQGDRVHVDAGLRLYGGPDTALLAQVPTQRTAFVAGTWAF